MAIRHPIYGAMVWKPGVGYVQASSAGDEYTDPRTRVWREDAPGWMRPDSPAGRVFDLQSRTNYGVANWALEQGRMIRDDVDDNPLTWYLRSQHAALRGLAGKDKVFFEDVIRESDWGKRQAEQRPWLPVVLGLAADIGLDPLTYAGGGLTKLGRAGKVAAATKTPGFAKLFPAAKFTADGLIDTAGMAGKTLRKANRWNRLVGSALKTMSVDDLAKTYKAGKATQAQAGMRGLSLFGQQIAAPVGYYKWGERFPAWLAGGEAGLRAIGEQAGPVYTKLDEAVPGLRRGLRQLGERFKAGDTLFEPLRKKVVGAKRAGFVQEAKFGEGIEPWAKRWREFVGKGGDDTDALTRTFLQTYELGPEAGRQLDLVHDAAKLGKIDEFADELRRLLWKPMEKTEQAALAKQGIPMHLLGATGQLDLFGKPELQHLTMFFDRDALVKLNRTAEGKRLVAHLMTLQDPGQLPRQFVGLTHVDVNTIGRRNLGELFGPAFNGMTVDRLLIEDPVQILALRGERVGRVVQGAEFLDGARQFLVPATDEALARGLVPVDITTKVGKQTYPVLDGLVGEPFIANEIKRIWNIGQDVESMNQLLRVYDNVLQTWRGYALMAPSYHVRNLFSNVWQNFLAGVTDPIAYSEAVRFQVAAKRQAKDGGAALRAFRWATPFGELDGQTIYRQLFDEDLLGGFMSEWQREVARLERGRAVGRMRGAHDAAQRFNLAFGGYIENNARIALYLDQLGKGIDPATAAQTTRHFLFDYTPTGLSTFEHEKVRRLTGFYRWTKNNMLLATEQMVKQPGKYAAIPKVKHAIEEMTAPGSPTEAYLPEWLSEGYAVRYHGGETPRYFNLQNWLPAMQVAELFEDIDEVPIPGFKWAMGLMAPTISVPLEQGMNQSIFFERPIEEYPGQRVEFMGQQVPARMAHLARTFRPLSEANRFTQGNPPIQAVGELFAGRTYDYDWRAQVRYAKFAKLERLAQLKRAWKRAVRDGDRREADRLRREILRTRQMRVVQ